MHVKEIYMPKVSTKMIAHYLSPSNQNPDFLEKAINMLYVEKLAQALNDIFILPQREAFIDEDDDIISKAASERRLFGFGVIFNLFAQSIIFITLLILEYEFLIADNNVKMNPFHHLGELNCNAYFIKLRKQNVNIFTEENDPMVNMLKIYNNFHNTAMELKMKNDFSFLVIKKQNYSDYVLNDYFFNDVYKEYYKIPRV